MDDRLQAVADAREIAAKTMRLIQQNFTAAVGINTGVLTGAILGWLSPVASALLHNGSTIGILVNALKGVSLDHRSQPPLPMPPPALPQSGAEQIADSVESASRGMP